jgi:hypothetical protein
MRKVIFQFSILTFLRSYVLTFFFCLFLAGCEKEVSDQLKGKWQLKTIEEAGHQTPVDTVWYNFQSESLFMYQIYHPKVDTFSWLYGYKTQPESNTIHLELTNWTISKEDFLPFTDWKEPARTFTVEKINRKQLILKGDDKTYSFDRF